MAVKINTGNVNILYRLKRRLVKSFKMHRLQLVNV